MSQRCLGPVCEHWRAETPRARGRLAVGDHSESWQPPCTNRRAGLVRLFLQRAERKRPLLFSCAEKSAHVVPDHSRLFTAERRVGVLAKAAAKAKARDSAFPSSSGLWSATPTSAALTRAGACGAQQNFLPEYAGFPRVASSEQPRAGGVGDSNVQGAVRSVFQ